MNRILIQKNTFKIIISLLLIIFLFNFFNLPVSAYYNPKEYRKSLLEIRDVERSIKDLEKKLKNAEESFRIIPANIKAQASSLEQYYQQIIAAYEKNNEQELKELSDLLIRKIENMKLKIIESKPVQLRAFWLDSGTFAKTNGKKGLVHLLDLAQKAKFNVIFPEIYYKGMSVIPSNDLFKQDPRFENWDQDPLQLLIKEAAKRNIEVHPWVWVFNENTSGKVGRILKENPEWANKNAAGEIVTYHNSTWLSPAREDVKNYLQKRYKYLVQNYDIQGINLDYIRFPEEYRDSFGYDKKSVSGFKKQYGLDPFQLKNKGAEASLWNKYRENLITTMVKETAEILKKVDSDLLISADVIPGINEARYRAMQNWSYWLKKDYIDFVLPMTYTENLFSELKNWLENDREQINKPLYAGISVFKLSSQQMIKQIEEVNSINPNGMSLFAAAHLKESDYYSLAEGIFSRTAVLASKNKEIALKKLQDFILDRLNIIKEAGKIKNKDLIKIRYYLNQRVNNKSNSSFLEFINQEDLTIDNNIKKILKSDFNYLSSIIRLY